MTALRVVHVVRQFAPGVGGLEEAVLKLALAQHERGTSASVVTLDRTRSDPATTLPGVDRVAGLPVTRIPFAGSWRYPVAPTVLAPVGAADVVHVHGIDFFFDFLAVTRPWHRKPLIASTHGGFFHTAFARRLKALYFRTATWGAARAYHAICASSRSDFALFRTIAPANVQLVENGVDTVKWAGLAPDQPRRHLIAIGRFAAHKQLTLLFPVLRALVERHPGWKLTIAGSPWDVSTEALRQDAAAAGVGAAVDILVAPTDDALADRIATASYIASASQHEGFGLSVVEGMAAGLVPVINDIPPFRDLLARSRCGRLVAVADAEATAAAIEALHQDGSARPRQAREAAMQAAGQFSWSTAADLFQGHYRAAVGRPGPSQLFREARP